MTDILCLEDKDGRLLLHDVACIVRVYAVDPDTHAGARSVIGAPDAETFVRNAVEDIRDALRRCVPPESFIKVEMR